MDPISVIVAALVAGAATALKETTGSAIRDGYTALKGLVLRRFKGDPEVASQVEAVEREPQANHDALRERLAATGASSDDQLLRQATDLLALVDPEGTRAGKYTVTVTGGKGVVVGDNATVTMNFDE